MGSTETRVPTKSGTKLKADGIAKPVGLRHDCAMVLFTKRQSFNPHSAGVINVGVTVHGRKVVTELLGLPHTARMRFSCGALCSVTMRQDMISIFDDVLFWMLKHWLAYSMI